MLILTNKVSCARRVLLLLFPRADLAIRGVCYLHPHLDIVFRTDIPAWESAQQSMQLVIVAAGRLWPVRLCAAVESHLH